MKVDAALTVSTQRAEGRQPGVRALEHPSAALSSLPIFFLKH